MSDSRCLKGAAVLRSAEKLSLWEMSGGMPGSQPGSCLVLTVWSESPMQRGSCRCRKGASCS